MRMIVKRAGKLKAVVEVHGSLTQSDLDCFCTSPLLVSTHTSLHIYVISFYIILIYFYFITFLL